MPCFLENTIPVYLIARGLHGTKRITYSLAFLLLHGLH
jgi:hypothetical protein